MPEETITRAAIRQECVTAVEAELRDYITSINQQKAERIVFLGDIVGYGADPVACLAEVREACATDAPPDPTP